MTFTLFHKSSVSSDRTERFADARRSQRLRLRRKGRLSERSRRLQFESLEERVVLAAVPVVTLLDVPADILIGEKSVHHLTVTFRNSSPTDVGFGPYIDLFLPATGFDGRNGAPNDGITLVPGSVKYLGAPVDVVPSVPISLILGGIPHPLAQDSTTTPFNITPPAGFFPGDQLSVLRLPFGSFTPNQPEVRIEFDVMVSALADVGVALPIYACGGFQFGADALNNPSTDPTIPAANSTANCAAAMTTPRLFTLSKTVDGLHDTTLGGGTEDETATGPNFGHQYTIAVNIADGQTVTNLQIADLLPPNLQYVALISVSGNGSTVVPSGTDSTPSTIMPGGTLSRTLDQVIGTLSGTDATMTFSFYVPCLDAAGAAVIDPVTGDDVPVVDTASATGDWLPVDLRDPGPNNTTDHVPISVSNSVTHTLIAKSIAVQKSWTVATELPGGGAGPTPGDVLEYTLNFQISDCFAFQDVTLTDTFSDGQMLVGSPTFSFTRGGSGGSTTSGTFVNPANVVVAPVGSIGETQVTFDLSNELINRTFAGGGIMLGAGVPNGGGPITNITAPGTTGVVKFSTTILDSFTHNVAPHTQSVDHGDCLNNGALLNGEVVNTVNLQSQVPQQFENDDSRVDLKISSGRLLKSIYSIEHNGVTVFNPTPTAQVQPGDKVTFHLQYSMPASSTDDLVIEDYLPLPIFDVSTVIAGTTSGHTFPVVPIITQSTTAALLNNRVTFDFGSFNDTTNQQTLIELFIEATVTNVPFADGLYLTNLGHVAEDTTNCGLHAQDAIVQVQIQEPLLNIYKGVIATDNPNGVFSPALPNSSFSAPGSPGFRYVGNPQLITSAATSLPTLIGSNLSNADAGDRVTFAIAVENIGSGSNGAFDVRLRDTIPAGFHLAVPLNLSITDGAGLDFFISGVIPSTGTCTAIACADFFAPAGFIELVDPGVTTTPTGALDPGKDNSGNLINDGHNLVFITYDLEADFPAPPSPGVPPMQPVAACQDLTNTATLLNYANEEAGPNFIPNHLTDTATVTIAPVALTKTVVDTSIVNANNTLTQAVIGEYITYSLTMTVPEGITAGATITDTLGPGLAFVTLVGVTPTYSSAAVTSSLFTATPNSTGTSVTFSFGTISNGADNGVPETITIVYQALVLNVASNQAPNLLHNSAVFSSQYCANQPAAGADVTIIEPVLQVDKSYIPSGPFDAGDTVTFTIVISNPGPNSTDAYDVTLSDFIPNGFTYVAGSLGYTGTPLTTSGVTGGFFSFITASWASFPLGSSGTFTYEATLNTNLTPCQDLTNQALVKWTSLPGGPGLILPTNPNSTERTGSGIDPNDYQAIDTATVHVECPTLTKSIVSTSEASTVGNQVTIGEIVRYQLMVELPDGAYTNFALQDFLPNYLQWIDPSQVTVTTVNATSFNFTAPTSITGNVTFNFGSFTNSDNDADSEFLIVEFNALVTNTPVNNAGDIKPNHFDVVLPVNPLMPSVTLSSNTVDVVIVEPHIAVDKQAIEVTGDHVTYTITITNTGTSTAFDTTFVDTLYNGPAILPFDLLPGGDSLTVTYTLRVRPCDDLSNEVIVTASSLPGTHGTFPNPTGTQTPGDPDDFDGERTYTVSDSVVLIDVGGPCGPIIGNKWLDANADGVRQPTEVGMGGVTIFADQDGDGVLDANEAFAVTSFDDPNTPNDETGQYTLNLPAGSYQIREVVPAGYYGPTNVPGGFYTLNFAAPFPALTFDFGNTPNGVGNFFLGSIHGVKFDDVDNDGLRDPGEPGVPFVRVYLDTNGDGSFQPIEPSMLTVTDDLNTASVDETGGYWFMNLGPGTYQVREDVPAFATQTSFPPPITIQSGDVWVGSGGQSIIGANQIERLEPKLDIGNHYEGYGSIHGCKFNDLNGNGIADDGEPGLPGVTFELYVLGADNEFHLLTTTTTSSTAAFWFDHLLPGTYQLIEIPAPGAIITTPPLADIILLPGQTVSFGDCAMPGSVHGEKWEDLDGDGLHDPNEPGVVGVQVYADLNDNGQFDNGEPTALTMADDPATAGVNEAGHYWLDVPPGTLTIREVLPAGFAQSFPMSNGGANVVAIGSGEMFEGTDFGNYRPVEFHGVKFEDKNGNGVQDAGELRLAGWTITVTGTDGMGNPVSVTTTTMADDPATLADETGMFWVLGLKPGTYTIEEQQQDGWVASVGGQGYSGTFPSGSGSSANAGTPARQFIFGNYRPGSIHGIKFDDTNGNGKLDPGEPGIENIPIEVSWTDPVTGQIVSQLTTTMARGEYWFEDMPIGVQYTVHELPEDELVLTIPAGGFSDGFVLDVLGCDGPLTIEFDNNEVFQRDTVVVQFSSNNEEEQIANDTVAALLASGKFVGVEKVGKDEVHIDLGCRMASTDPIKPFMLMSGQEFVATHPQKEALIAGGLSPERVIVRPDLAIGNVTLGSIHGLKFEDRKANGLRDAGEPGLPGWTITLVGFNGLGQSVSLSTTTMSDNSGTVENESGQYWFTGLKPGTYTVGEVQQFGWEISTLLQSYVLRSGQELVSERGQAHLPDGSPKQEKEVERLAIGNFRRGSVHGVKFDDANGDGRQDEREALLPGWTIKLAGVDGMGNPVDLETTTMADDPRTKPNELGMFWFDNLMPGTYELSEVSKAGWVRTVPILDSYSVDLFSGELLDGYAFGNHKSFEFAPPILDVRLIPDFPSILTDVSDENNQGTSVAAFIGPFYPYPQVPLGYKAGLVVTGANNAQGVWQYSRDGGAMWTTFAGVTPMTAVLLGAEPGDRLRFVPQAGFHGTVDPGLTFRLAILSDIEVFSTSSPIDVSIRGVGTPFSAEIGTTKISVNAHEARFTLRVTNPSGQPITSVMVGGQFVLEGYVQDTRTSALGVFAAYEDIFYDGSLVQVAGAITIDPLFPNAPSGSSSTLGVLDEVGGTADIDPTGGSTLLLFRQSFTATGPGTADFYINPADASAHQVLLYFNASTTPPQNIDFVGASLTIEQSGWQNPGNPLDVDDDGFVVPLDALIIINDLNSFGSHALPPDRPASTAYLDVNGDRFVSPLDVLLVFNHLNSAASGEGEASSDRIAQPVAVGDAARIARPPQLPLTEKSQSEFLRATDAYFAVLDDKQLERWTRRNGNGIRHRDVSSLLPFRMSDGAPLTEVRSN